MDVSHKEVPLVSAWKQIFGATFIVAGMALVAFAFGQNLGGATVHAGEVSCGNATATSTPDPSPVASPTPEPTAGAGSIESLQQLPTCSPTPDDDDNRPTRTSTPTKTATAQATSTQPPAPTSTPLGGGVQAGGVQPPNTGTGPEDGAGPAVWLLAVGAMLALAGRGVIASGARRRG